MWFFVRLQFMKMFIVIIIQFDIKLVVVNNFTGIIDDNKFQSFLIGIEILGVELFTR